MKGVPLSTRTGEIAAPVAFLSFAVLLLLGSMKQPDFGASNQSPGIFPALVAVIMIVTSVSQLIKLGVAQSKNSSDLEKAETGQSIQQTQGTWTPALYLLLIVGYVLLLGRINFLVATFLFLATSMLLLRAGNLIKIGVVSALSVLAFRLIFETIFKVVLP